jgi:hypothetical protein
MLSSVRNRALTVTVVLATALLTQMPPVFATALPSAASAVPASHAPGVASAKNAPGRSRPPAIRRLTTKAAPGFGLTRRPAAWDPTRIPAAGSLALVRARRADAVRTALARTTVPDTCSGSIQPDTVYPCTTPSASGTDTFTLTLTSSTDLLLIRVLDAAGNSLNFTLTAPDNSPVSCQQPSFNQIPQCATSQAGVYTLQVQNAGGSYALAYRALLSDASCTAANPSFAAPALMATLAAGGVGSCYTLAMTAGQVLHANSTSVQQDLLVRVYDSTGAQICFDNQGDCTLTGTGPYFVQADAVSAGATTYDLELNNLTDPQGCIVTAPLTYGSAADASSAVRCRTLSVPAAGRYQVYAVSPQQGLVPSTLYQPDGTVACTSTFSSTAPTCQLAAGTYNLVADPFAGSAADVGAVFIAAAESQGCQATGSSDFASAPATGTFSGLGEEICLTLPSTTGPAVYLFNQPAAGPDEPQLEVVDATGAQVCQANGELFTNCTLTGTQPFRVILSGQQEGGGYRVLAQSSKSASGCAAWPQSGFGGAFGATVKLTAAADAACLAIPAQQHSTGEMIDYSNLKNTVDGSINIFDPAGNSSCIGASTAICPLQSGVAYTALLISGTGQPDTYHLVRRDVSSTAHCSAPASTVAGGKSTTVQLTSALDTQCLRVTGPAADKYSFDLRATAPNSAGAVLQVTNASGAIVCGQFAGFCQATGSTSYQLLVSALGYQGIAITAHVDTWLVGTAGGFAPACTAHQLSAGNGWGPVKVSMSETVTGYCAVLTVGANQDSSIYSPSTTGTGRDQPFMSVQSGANWANGQNLCSSGQTFEACDLFLNTAPGQYILLVHPFQMPLPTTLSFQGVCTFGCAGPRRVPDITSVTPAAGRAGSINQLVIHGTDLNLGVEVDLSSNANTVAAATPVSVTADGTALTVLLDTHGVTPGLYDLVQSGVGFTVGTPSPGYLPGAYRVTTGPSAPPVGTFVPANPARILDTRTGLGGRKGPLRPHSVVALKVAGVAGVPATRVSAVMVNVTALQPSKAGTLTVYPDRTARPLVTDVSFSAGQARSDQVVVPVVDGKIDLYNNSAGTTGLVVMLAGYFTSAGAHGRLTAVNPARILDTRTGLGARKARLGARQSVRLTVDGVGRVPKSGVSAVELLVTVLSPARTGGLTAFADGRPRPAVSQLSFSAGQTTADLITIPVAGGKVDLYNSSAGQVGLTADVAGYFSGKGAAIQTAGPVRVLDTRSGLGGAGVSVLAHSAADLSVDDLPGFQGTQQDVVLSVTVTGTRLAGSLFAFPDGSAIPADPTLVFGAGKSVTVQVIVPITGPTIDFFNDSGGTIQILADVQAYGVAG